MQGGGAEGVSNLKFKKNIVQYIEMQVFKVVDYKFDKKICRRQGEEARGVLNSKFMKNIV